MPHCKPEQAGKRAGVPNPEVMTLIEAERADLGITPRDFTAEEISNAQASGFQGVSIGDKRLRTETAALAVAVMFSLNKGH